MEHASIAESFCCSSTCRARGRNLKKKILIVGPFPPPVGGDTIFTSNVFKSTHWNRNGLILDRIDTSPKRGLKLPEDRLAVRDILRGIRLFFMYMFRLPSVDGVLLLANTRFLLTIGAAMIYLASLVGKPIGVWLFSTYFVKRLDDSPRLWRRIAVGALKRADWLFVQTELLIDILHRRFHLDRSKLIFFPNFVPDRFIMEREAHKEFAGRCVFIGQIKREKGVFDIIDAVASRAGYICDFYGPIHERDRDDFLRRIEETDNIKYRGEVEHDRVVETIAEYDVFLLPTFHPSEGYPAVLFEAFAAQVPVIATDWLAIGEIVADGERGILVPVHSPERIAEALDRLRADADLYRNLCRGASDYVKGFSESAVLRDILISRFKERLGAKGDVAPPTAASE